MIGSNSCFFCSLLRRRLSLGSCSLLAISLSLAPPLSLHACLLSGTLSLPVAALLKCLYFSVLFACQELCVALLFRLLSAMLVQYLLHCSHLLSSVLLGICLGSTLSFICFLFFGMVASRSWVLPSLGTVVFLGCSGIARGLDSLARF